MEELDNTILKIISPIIAEQGVELVDMEVRGGRGSKVVKVFVDVPGGISIDRCVDLSRELGDALDIADVISSKYRLEVSSPGVDRPLKTPRDFERNISRLVEIKYRENQQITTTAGEILRVEEATVVIQTDDGAEQSIRFDQIDKALIQIRWS